VFLNEIQRLYTESTNSLQKDAFPFLMLIFGTIYTTPSLHTKLYFLRYFGYYQRKNCSELHN